MMKIVNYLIPALILAGCSQPSSDNEVQKTPSTIESPANGNSSLPYLLVAANDKMYMSWVEEQGDSTYLNYASFSNDQWTEPSLIAIGTDWFVNWADYPMVAANENGEMLAHYLAKSAAGTYSYDVNIRRNAGTGWTEPIIPHTDGTPTEHGFVSMVPLPDQSFQLAWLDGRNTSGDHGAHHGAMTLRTAVMDIEGNISNESVLDNRVCDCCQTSGAMTSNGPIFVYRDRSELEIRDMAIVRMVNGNWTEPRTIYSDQWKINGCPVNGPRVSAIGNTLGVAWFSVPNGKPQVKVIFSEDGGASFGKPVMIDEKSPVGRVDMVMINNKSAYVSWLGKEGEKTVIKTCKVNLNGQVGTPVVIAETSDARASGFPQMELYNGQLYFAWTELKDDKSSKVRLAQIENPG